MDSRNVDWKGSQEVTQSSLNIPSLNSWPLSPVSLADASEAERKSSESPSIPLLPGAMAWQHHL